MASDDPALFTAILESLPGGLLVEGPDRFIRYVTPSLCEIFSIPMSPTAMLGLDCATLVDGAKQAFKDPHHFVASTNAAIQNGRPVLETLPLKDGRVLTRAYTPLGGGMGGHLWHYRVALKESVEDTEMHERVRSAEAASVAKTSFLATMSHEIRTPLSAIVGLTELAGRADPTPQLKRYLAGIRAGSESLLTLINDVLDFSKIEAGHLDISPHSTDPAALVRTVCKVHGAAATAKSVDLWSHCEANLPSRVMLDEARCRQILMNLVGNALKFTPRGAVSVHLDGVRIPGDRARLRFRVSDTGIGISPDDQERVFLDFQQVRGSSGLEGTGLGLAISRALARAMGGDISCRSVPGQGSVFAVELTVPIDLAAPDAPPPSELLAGQEHHVAIVGARHDMLSTSYVAMLSELGVHPHVATIEELSAWSGPALSAVIGHRMTLPTTFDSQLPKIRVVRAVQVEGPFDIPIPLNEQVLREALTTVLVPNLPTVRRVPLEAPTYKRRGGATILVAEDQRANQAVIVKLLEDEGYKVDVVPDGLRAVEACHHRNYELILMDVEMPEMDGFEATRRIRQDEAARGSESVPIIGITAHATKEVKTRCLASGMDEFMPKPLDPRHFVQLVARTIGQRPTLLIVDDSVEQRSLLSFYFDPKSYRLVLAASGADALRLVGRNTIDLAMVDMQMPGMSGLELVKELRSLPSFKGVPIVALTAARGAYVTRECLDAGCTEFFSKPARRGPLVQTIERLLDLPDQGTIPAAEATQRNLPVFGQLAPSTVSVSKDMQELVEDYIGIVRATVVSLKDALEASRMDSIRRHGHNLLGSGAAYGFRHISIIGGQLEACQRPPEVHGLISELESYLDRVTVHYT